MSSLEERGDQVATKSGRPQEEEDGQENKAKTTDLEVTVSEDMEHEETVQVTGFRKINQS